jgi:multidrug resistance efflux pump
VNRKSLVLAVVALGAGAVALGCFWPFGNGQASLRLSGIVEIQEVRLGSKVGGRVDKIAVAEGDLVKPGQPLVYFEVPELTAQRDQLRAKVKAAEADVERAENGPRYQEKAAARAAAEAAYARWQRMEYGWREEEKRQALSELESASAELKQTEEDYFRIVQLSRQKSASQADFDSARAARDRAQGRANAARARWDMLRTGNRKEDKDEAKAEYERARANADLLEEGTRQEDKDEARARLADVRAKLSEIEVNLAEAVVYAPEKAIVEVLAVRKGDLVSPNTPIIRVLRAEDLWVKVYVPETELGKVRLHQDVEVKIDSYPNKRFLGKVIQVASISEFTPRNVQSAEERRHQVFAVKVRVDNPQGIFKSGMAAEVVLPLAQ